MKAILLAAGRGERLRPRTDQVPKPLLPIGGTTLIERHLQALSAAGISEAVINVQHLGQLIMDQLGSESHGVQLHYSVESERLETGGGIRRALPILGEEPFLVVSADIYVEIDSLLFSDSLAEDCLAKLLMVNNPEHHTEGDFAIGSDRILSHSGAKYTYSGIMLMRPALVADEAEPHFMLRKVFDLNIEKARLQGVLHDGYWCDVGTEERYQALLRRVERVE